MWGDEERVAADPSQTCRYGIALLGQGHGIDKGTSGDRGVVLADGLQELMEHLLDGDVVVAVAGIRGDLGPMLGRVTGTDRTLIAYGADDDRSRLID